MSLLGLAKEKPPDYIPHADGPAPPILVQPSPYGYPPPNIHPPMPPGSEWMMPPPYGLLDCPPGLEYLASVDKLLVHQKVELLETITGFEANNKYTVKNCLGQKVYLALEDSNWFNRMGGPMRPFEMKILNNFGKEIPVASLTNPLPIFLTLAGAADVLTSRKQGPFACHGRVLLQRLALYSPTGKVGSVEQERTLLQPQYGVRSETGETVLWIHPLDILTCPQVIHLHRPFACHGCVCPFWLQRLAVYSPPGKKVGSVEQEWTLLQPQYGVRSETGETVLRIHPLDILTCPQVIHLHRPFACHGCVCPFWLQRLAVYSPPGKKVGSVEQEWTLLQPQYGVRSETGETVLRIHPLDILTCPQVIHLHRPFACHGCVCPFWLQRLAVYSPPGKKVGSVEQERTLLQPQYGVRSSVGETVPRIHPLDILTCPQVIHLHRPFACHGCVCPFWLQRLAVYSPPGKKVGSVEQERTLLQPQYGVRSSVGETVPRIHPLDILTCPQVIHLHRPFACHGCVCPFWLQRLAVYSPPGKKVGSVEQERTLLQPQYGVRSSVGETVPRIHPLDILTCPQVIHLHRPFACHGCVCPFWLQRLAVYSPPGKKVGSVEQERTLLQPQYGVRSSVGETVPRIHPLDILTCPQVIHLQRPFACHGCVCPFWLQRLAVYSPPGKKVGSVEQEWTLLQPQYGVRSETGDTVLRIHPLDILTCPQVIHLHWPFACHGCVCPFWLQRLAVYSPPGKKVGSVEQEWTLLQPQYSVRNSAGETVLRIHPLDILTCPQVIHLHRPFACHGCVCPFWLQRLAVYSPPGKKVGSVEQEWTLLQPQYSVRNSAGETVLRIKGPTCRFTFAVEFSVCSADGRTEIGKITRHWSGLAREVFTDADYFGISFPADLDVRIKAVLLGACFLIDFMFFED